MESPLQEQPTLPGKKIATDENTHLTLDGMNLALHDLLAHTVEIRVAGFDILLHRRCVYHAFHSGPVGCVP